MTGKKQGGHTLIAEPRGGNQTENAAKNIVLFDQMHNPQGPRPYLLMLPTSHIITAARQKHLETANLEKDLFQAGKKALFSAKIN
ncbi:MAG: hypothetical protein KGS72_07350 [Cyanobacteria bacterium REEB67]|nr:hypothetical protein [Cyanobacteria bacterium REEB67]